MSFPLTHGYFREVSKIYALVTLKEEINLSRISSSSNKSNPRLQRGLYYCPINDCHRKKNSEQKQALMS